MVVLGAGEGRVLVATVPGHCPLRFDVSHPWQKYRLVGQKAFICPRAWHTGEARGRPLGRGEPSGGSVVLAQSQREDGQAPCLDRLPRLHAGRSSDGSGGRQRERQVYTGVRCPPAVQSKDGRALRKDGRALRKDFSAGPQRLRVLQAQTHPTPHVGPALSSAPFPPCAAEEVPPG